VLAVDIGRTNIRTGVVRFNLNAAADIAKAKVWKYELWRHGDEKLSRHEAVEGLVSYAKAPDQPRQTCKSETRALIGIGCPGKIESDGSIDSGGQNLPGNWESGGFNLPQ